MSIVENRDLKVITVDCRELVPPEPMVQILEAIEKMGNDEAVLMLHRKKPNLLFPKLKEKGLDFELTEKNEDNIELLIWRP